MKYTKKKQLSGKTIQAEVDGKILFIPEDNNNRHYKELKQEEEENK